MWIIPRSLPLSSFASVLEGFITELPEFFQACSSSLLARSKVTPSATWSRRWKKGDSLRLLYGRISKPSLHQTFTDLWISSLRASLVNRSPMPASVGETKIPGIFSPISSNPSSPCSPDSSCSKTSKGSSAPSWLETDGATPLEPLYCSMSAENWKGLVTAQRGEYSARLKRAEATSASGFLSSLSDPIWYTPNVPNGGRVNPESMSSTGALENGKKRQVGLEHQTKHWLTPHGMSGVDKNGKEGSGGEFAKQATTWMTPRVAVGEYTRDGGEKGKERPTLEGQCATRPTPTSINRVRSEETMQKCADFRKRNANQNTVPLYLEEVALKWPTPAARDGKGTNSETHCTETGTGRKHMDQLPNFVAHSPHLDRTTPTDGGESSNTAPTSRLRLNVLFVEWLMDWPENHTCCRCASIALTGCASAETESTKEPQK